MMRNHIFISGAGDNAISCSVMLEMLRVFSISKEVIQHNLIFLFNGAEENLLQVLFKKSVYKNSSMMNTYMNRPPVKRRR